MKNIMMSCYLLLNRPNRRIWIEMNLQVTRRLGAVEICSIIHKIYGGRQKTTKPDHDPLFQSHQHEIKYPPSCRRNIPRAPDKSTSRNNPWRLPYSKPHKNVANTPGSVGVGKNGNSSRRDATGTGTICRLVLRPGRTCLFILSRSGGERVTAKFSRAHTADTRGTGMKLTPEDGRLVPSRGTWEEEAN